MEVPGGDRFQEGDREQVQRAQLSDLLPHLPGREDREGDHGISPG